MSEAYLWIKALHLIAIISWMAGLLYLPRLFVYHTQAIPGGELAKTLQIMEHRLLRIIMLPAMIATWIFGLWLAYIWGLDGLKSEGWFHAKLLFVILLSAYHGMLSRWRKDFAQDRNKHSQKFFRLINEVPTLLMVVIVFLVVLKPF